MNQIVRANPNKTWGFNLTCSQFQTDEGWLNEATSTLVNNLLGRRLSRSICGSKTMLSSFVRILTFLLCIGAEISTNWKRASQNPWLWLSHGSVREEVMWVKRGGEIRQRTVAVLVKILWLWILSAFCFDKFSYHYNTSWCCSHSLVSNELPNTDWKYFSISFRWQSSINHYEKKSYINIKHTKW